MSNLKFKVGDKVKIVKDAGRDGRHLYSKHIGKTCIVVNINYCDCVSLSGIDDRIFYPSDLELVDQKKEEVSMKFKVGDRVRIVENIVFSDNYRVGDEGTVIRLGKKDVFVRFDRNPDSNQVTVNGCRDIELIAESLNFNTATSTLLSGSDKVAKRVDNGTYIFESKGKLYWDIDNTFEPKEGLRVTFCKQNLSHRFELVDKPKREVQYLKSLIQILKEYPDFYLNENGSFAHKNWDNVIANSMLQYFGRPLSEASKWYRYSPNWLHYKQPNTHLS